MSASGKKVFLVGAGYIGSEVLDRLLENDYKVSALARREAAASELKERGVWPVLGSLEDAVTIEQQVEAHDIVFHTATADDLQSVESIIRGIDRRASQNKHTIYIHTSGTSLLNDDSAGKYKSETIYSDKTPDQIDALPDTASHRLIDLAIIKARQRLGTKAKLFIMLPPLIYGATKHERLSIQIITMARFAMKHKYAGFVGGGQSVWNTVHVSDLSRGYLTVLQWLVTSPPETALEHPYFFCENGQEISWEGAAAIVGDALHAAGRLGDPKPREVPKDQYDDLFGRYSVVVIGANSRSRADRLRQLGWKPTEVDVREAFESQELPILLKDTSDFKGYGKVAASGSS